MANDPTLHLVILEYFDERKNDDNCKFTYKELPRHFPENDITTSLEHCKKQGFLTLDLYPSKIAGFAKITAKGEAHLARIKNRQ